MDGSEIVLVFVATENAARHGGVVRRDFPPLFGQSSGGNGRQERLMGWPVKSANAPLVAERCIMV
jgi:hypothetical protein